MGWQVGGWFAVGFKGLVGSLGCLVQGVGLGVGCFQGRQRVWLEQGCVPAPFLLDGFRF